MSFNKILARARTLLLALIATPMLALAAPTYTVIGGISTNQTGGPFITDLGTGFSRWVTPLDFTNNNPIAVGHIYFIATAQWVQGNPVDANAMQWNNAAGQFEKGGLIGKEDNAALFINLADTNIGALNPVFGISPTDSLAAFDLGFIGLGATTSTEINFQMSSSIGTMWFNGFFVQDAAARLPEPAGLALVALALAGATLARRRRSA